MDFGLDNIVLGTKVILNDSDLNYAELSLTPAEAIAIKQFDTIEYKGVNYDINSTKFKVTEENNQNEIIINVTEQK